MNRGILFTIISSIILITDFLTKQIIVEKVMLYERIKVLPFLNIVHVENKGAAFGMFTGLGNNFFIVISIAAIIFIGIYAWKVTTRSELISLSLILGGAAGNLLDRLRFGKVIDFIDIFVNDWHWPAFNVADSSLTVGITILILHNLVHGAKQGEMNNSQGQQDN